jgi:hypothetical protein
MICVRIPVTTTGANGSALGSTTVSIQPHSGVLHAVYLDYHADAPGATTDVTISQASGPALALLTVSDNVTDGWYLPRRGTCGVTGTALSYGDGYTVNEPQPVTGGLTVAVAQSNALTNCVVAWCFIQEDVRK